MPVYEQHQITTTPRPLLKGDFLKVIFDIAQELQSITGTQKCDVFQAGSNLDIIRQLQVVSISLCQAILVNLLLGAVCELHVDISCLVEADDSATATQMLPTFNPASNCRQTMEAI